MDAKEGSNNFIVGFLVGAVSMLPGISGGIVAVLFGIYERLIDDINHIRTKIKEDLGFLLTVGGGIFLGLLVFVYITDWLLGAFFVATMFFFVGLIIGQLPDLIRITKKGEPTRGPHIVWLALGLAIMIGLLFLELRTGGGGGEAVIESSGLLIGVLLSFFAGAILALSKIIPGISGSTVLLALGLFTWMLTIITDFKLVYLLPFCIGFVIAVFAFAKVMGYILENHHHTVYYFITGLTVGSIILIAAITDVSGFGDMLMGCAAAAVGIIVSLAFGMMLRPKKNALRT
jgi:putative membrane protein